MELYQYITKDILSVLRFICIFYITLFGFTAIIFGGIAYIIEKYMDKKLEIEKQRTAISDFMDHQYDTDDD